MSNYQYVGFLDDNAVVGPETVNGTGHVYLAADDLCFLTNDEARTLGAALIAAADYAKAVHDEMEEQPGGMPPGSVRRYAWTDPAWRIAIEAPQPECEEHDVNEWACVAHPQTGHLTHVKRARSGCRVDFTGSSLHGALDPLETGEEQP